MEGFRHGSPQVSATNDVDVLLDFGHGSLKAPASKNVGVLGFWLGSPKASAANDVDVLDFLAWIPKGICFK